jgi:PTH1 family peptidyl-tRNA hydrolase
MKLVAGLGNPGSQYAQTRHNVGYRVVEKLAGRWGISIQQERFSGWIGTGTVCGVPSVLLKPTTFMNRSGQSVGEAWRFYKLEGADVLVIADDMDLALGRVRLRAQGSSGGHKGVGDILEALGGDDFARLRVGIGRDPAREPIDHVLSRFEPDELVTIERVVDRAAEAVECWVTHGIEEAMNRYNGPWEGDGAGQSNPLPVGEPH